MRQRSAKRSMPDDVPPEGGPVPSEIERTVTRAGTRAVPALGDLGLHRERGPDRVRLPDSPRDIFTLVTSVERAS